MAESTAPDPVELWRELLTQWERSVNDISSKVMTTSEFSSGANQVTMMFLKLQESLNELLDKYFRALNLPTRKDVERLDERMMAIEDLLHSMSALLDRISPPREDFAESLHEFEPVAVDQTLEALEAGTIEDVAIVTAPAHIADVAADDLPDIPPLGRPKRAASAAAKITAPKATKKPPRTKKPPSKKSSGAT